MERQFCGGFGGRGNGRHERGERKDRDNFDPVASSLDYVTSQVVDLTCVRGKYPNDCGDEGGQGQRAVAARDRDLKVRRGISEVGIIQT